MEQIKGLLRKPMRAMRRTLSKFRANCYLARLEKRGCSEDGKITVLFVVQMPEIWNKEAAVFEAMMRHPRFRPELIVVPSYNIVHAEIGEYGSELSFFEQQYGKEYVRKALDNDWLDLRELYPDYVFYQRCWEDYLPKQYHASEVVKFSKTCYIPYCFHVLKDPASYYRNSFFFNLYMFFCCSEQQKMLQRASRRNKNLFLGYPELEAVTLSKQKNNELLSVLWTPRWTDDEETGGSSFLRYMEDVLALGKEIPGVDVMLRPHPMAFQNAIRKEKLTEEDEREYRSRALAAGVRFDENKAIEETFPETDVLLTDFSSVLIPFFLTGKPIIYCARTNLEFSEVAQKVVDCSYKAKDWTEVLDIMKDLKNGKDELRERRIAFAKELKEINEGAADRILNAILNDAK